MRIGAWGRWAEYPAILIDTQTQPTHTLAQTYKVMDTRAETQSQGCFMPRYPATPLHRCPSLARVCLQPHLPHPPAWEAAGASSLCPFPAAPAGPSVSSSGRPRSSHQADPPPRSLSPAFPQPLSLSLCAASHCSRCLSISPRSSLSPPAVPPGSLLVSRSLSPVSSPLTGL